MAKQFDAKRLGLVMWATPNYVFQAPEQVDPAFAALASLFDKAGITENRMTEVFAGDDMRIAEAIAIAGKKYSIDRGVCIFNAEGSDHLPTDTAEGERAFKKLLLNIDYAGEAAGDGFRVASGPFYCAHMRNLNQPFSEEEHGILVDYLGQAVNHARSRGVYLAAEILNRGETNVLNTVGQGLYLVKKIGSKHFVLHLDTIHQSLEEGGIDQIIPSWEKVLVLDAAGHIHLSDDPRQEWGKGKIARLNQQINDKLDEHQYKRGVVIENFDDTLDGAVGITNRSIDQINQPMAVNLRSLRYAAHYMK